MKNGYRVILMCLAVLGVVYAGAGPDKKAEDEKESDWPCYKGEEVQYKPLDLCKFSVSIDVGRYIQLKECNKRKIELKQVACKELSLDNAQFPCYKGSDVIEVRANFPAIFSASIDKNEGGEDMLEEVNLYWENGVNTIQGTGEWEELKLCLEAWKVKIWKSGGTIGTVDIGEITIDVRPPDIALCDKAPMPRSSILVRPDVASADFAGTWTGQATDKPDEGSTTDTMILHVRESSESDWTASISGTFPSDGQQEVGQIQLVDNKIGFYMQAMDGKTVVWLGLHPTEDDRLIGESFALDPDCDGRNIELIRKKEK